MTNFRSTRQRLLALEPRCLLDGAALQTAAEAVPVDTFEAQPRHGTTPLADADPVAAITPHSDIALRRVAFVDPAVADSATLSRILLEQSAQVVLLEADGDGFAQIARHLRTLGAVDSVEIFSHGAAGRLQLAGREVSSADLGTHFAPALRNIAEHLRPGADLLLYGCNLGDTGQGRAFVEQLAMLTGADVAASEDLTGHHGDWALEVTVGDVDFARAAQSFAQFGGTLSANPVVNLDADNSAGLSGSDSTTTFHAHASAGRLTESDVEITDADHTDLASMQISVSNIQDDANELLIFGGDGGTSTTVDLDGVSNDNRIVVNGVTFDIDFNGTAFAITNNAGGTTSIANFESLLAAITYRNIDQTPTSGTRTFAIGVTDPAGDGSVAANARVIVSSGGTPDISLNGVFAYEGVYATWFFNDASDPFRGDSTSGMVSNMADVKRGSGLNMTDDFTRLVVTDVQSTTFEDAIESNEYIELEFTTPTGADALLLFEGLIRRVGSTEIPDVANEYPYQLAMQVSRNVGFEDAVTVFEDTTMNDPGTSTTDNVDWGDLDWVTQPGQTYYFRFYFYNVTSPLGEAAIDDIGFQGLSVTRDWARTFNEGNPPVLVGAGDGYVNDFSESDITSLSIVAAGVSEPAQEDLIIGGTTFALGTNVTTPVSVTSGLTTFHVTYASGTGTFNIVEATGAVMPDTDLSALVNSLFYENRKVVPTAGDRTFTLTVSDGTYTSPSAVSTITVVPDPKPTLDLDADDSEGTGGADFVNTFTEGGGAVAVAHTDADIADADSTQISRARITVGGLLDGVDEKLIFNGDAGTSTTVALNAASNTTVFVTGNVFDLAYDGTTFDVTLNGGGNMELTDVEKMISNITYTNTSSNPSEGARTLDFVVTDPNSNSSNTARSTITVDNINGPPTADNESNSTGEDDILLVLNGSSGDILVGDTDPDGDTLTITHINGNAYTPGTTLTLASGALLTVNGNGSYIYNPNGQFDTLSAGTQATETYTYTINDGNGQAATATVTITIQGANDLPVSAGNAVTTPEDTDYIFEVADFPYTDAESEPMTNVRIDTLPTDGKLFVGTTEVTGAITLSVAQITADQLIFRPDPTENGTNYATFDFSVSDGNGFAPSATMTVNVTPGNDPPTADNEAVVVTEDTVFLAVNESADDILIGDTDPDGDTLSIFQINGAAYTPGTQITLPSGALLTVNANGSYFYDPNGQFEALDDTETAADSYTYSIRDPSGQSATATVSITVNGANDAPTSADNAVTTLEDTDYPFSIGDFPFTDVDVEAIAQVRLDTLATDGQVILNGAQVTGVVTVSVATITGGGLLFRPDPDENGTGYATFDFSVSDGTAFSPSATMTVHVTPVLESPVADDDSAPYAGVAVVVDVADGDTDPDDGLDLSSVAITSNPPGSTLGAGGKSLVVPGEGTWTVTPGATGTISFTPQAGFTGIPNAITYTIDNTPGTETSNAATVTLTDTVAPLAQDDTGAFTGAPVTVDAPVNDNTTGPIDPTTVRITSNPTGSTLASNGKSLIVPNEGTWTVNLASGAITFSPNAGFTDLPSAIQYEADDASGNTSNRATVTLTDGATPLAQDDTGFFVGGPITLNVIGNDAAGEPVVGSTVVFVNPPTGATIAPGGKTLTVPGEGVWSADASTGAITFSPDAGFTGTPTAIDYTVDDARGNTSNDATVTLSVGLTPVTADDGGAFAGAPITVAVLGNDTAGDPPDPSTVVITSVPTGATLAPDGKSLVVPNEGTWSVHPTSGDITFAPVTGFTLAPTPITYTVNSFTATTSAPAAVRLTDQTPPVAVDDTGTGAPGPITVNVTANDLPEPVEPTTVRITSNPAGTTLAVNGKTLTVPGEGVWTVNTLSGAATFTPEPAFSDDPTPITYSVEDAAGNTDTATITINYGPIATDDAPNNLAPGPTTVAVLANDTTGDTVVPGTLRLLDPTTGNPTLSATIPGEGVWTVDPATAQITFTPQAGFQRDPTPISYRVADAGGATDTAVVTLDYAPIAVDDEAAYTTGPVSVDVLSNDIDGVPNTVRLVDPVGALTANLTVPGEGVWSADPVTGSITFTPEPTFSGDPTPVRYSVSDDDGNRVIANLRVGQAPSASDDSVSGAALGPVVIDVTANDVGGDPVVPAT
nr:tandem-95 repeat protein [Gammaproteobacteria bacterium]